MTVGTNAFIGTNSPFTVGVFDLGAKTFTRPTNPQPLPGEGPRAVKDGTLVLDIDPPYGVWLLHDDATYLKLFDASANKIAPSVAVDRSANDQIVWTEGDDLGMQYANVTIWTSPYASAPGGIQKKQVAKLSDPDMRGGSRMVANAGVVLNRVSKTKALITRLSDGWGWMFDAEPNEQFGVPYWIDAQYAYMITMPDIQGAASAGIMRLARAGLGNPTVPPF